MLREMRRNYARLIGFSLEKNEFVARWTALTVKGKAENAFREKRRDLERD